MNDFFNASYFFIPFLYEDSRNFRRLQQELNQGRVWEPVHDELRYLLKYVADKLDSSHPEKCCCFHYRLRDDARQTAMLQAPDTCFFLRPHSCYGREETFSFRIPQVHLFSFSTSVCILAFRLEFLDRDPFRIAALQYHLKKVSKERLHAEGQPEFTLLAAAKALMAGVNLDFQFFFYANPTTERANVLTYLDVEPRDDYKKELYYLRRCYNDGYLYTENPEQDKEEICSLSREIVWGISPEAAVCLGCPAHGDGQFLHEKFFPNFQVQYLFTYVLLLHQKYVLYMFLTRIGIGGLNDLEMLEAYRRELYEFDADFVFSCVTEVPQYQTIYNRMMHIFALKDMYEDIHEPLLSLAEERRIDLEKQQKERSRRMDQALLYLALLSLFSALVDGFDFAGSFFSWFLPAGSIWIAQLVSIVIVLVILVLVVINLFKSKKK